jgi:hypothetical protein
MEAGQLNEELQLPLCTAGSFCGTGGSEKAHQCCMPPAMHRHKQLRPRPWRCGRMLGQPGDTV